MFQYTFVFNFRFMNQYLIIRASKDIAKDEEIFNCYGILQFV